MTADQDLEVIAKMLGGVLFENAIYTPIAAETRLSCEGCVFIERSPGFCARFLDETNTSCEVVIWQKVILK